VHIRDLPHKSDPYQPQLQSNSGAIRKPPQGTDDTSKPCCGIYLNYGLNHFIST